MTTLCLDDYQTSEQLVNDFVRKAVTFRCQVLNLSPAQHCLCRRAAMDALAEGRTPSAAINLGWRKAHDLNRQRDRQQ